ncbi:MAG: thioredoxin family protein [Deltaproteobacteria bacterium]|nr:thioredoxin family protein [Deltaproteobacteria bacterium]
MQKPVSLAAALVLALTLIFSLAPAALAVPMELPVKNQVTLLDFGANQCVPCRMMAPILAEVKQEYAGAAAVVVLDVWQERSLTDQYGIRVIPTQIFYDRSGKEYLRHEGFMPKERIEMVLKALGVTKPSRP